MELITPTQIYWFTRLDGLMALFTICTIIGIAVSGIAGIIYMLTATDSSEKVANENSGKIFRRMLPVAIFGICGLLFVPSTKEAAAIWAIPAVVNNPNIQNIGTNTLDIAGIGLQYLKVELERQINKENK